jgi:hypothetical protein
LEGVEVRRRLAGFVLVVGLVLGPAAGRSPASPVVLAGRVTDGPGAPLAGVQVRAFAAGKLAASTESDSGGRYRVAFPVEPAEDPTVVVWWIPATFNKAGVVLVPELLILRESRAALEAKLFSLCLPRRAPADSMEYDPVLRGEDEKLKELAESDCLPRWGPDSLSPR